ncbi:aldo-keto reductase AKR2E4-like [Battus philenor]|uniref:aldo-keto reductase AKR2E4-like n=1 Tax=Battus philenor TaxID=42288 RepID=UPI0035CEA3A1
MSYSLHFVLFVLVVYNSGVRAAQAPLKLLNDGNKIPIIALGTHGTSDDLARVRQVIYWAIEVGYRHFDTAESYGNEGAIGEAIAKTIKDGLVKREELFITTKLWNNHHKRSSVIPALEHSLKRLGLNYVDLYLIHSPVAQKDDNTFDDIDYLETWQGMEDAKKLGLTKSIGVSNFKMEQINRLLNNSETKPAINQVEVNPTFTQEPLVSYCQSVGIEVMAYTPFGYMVSRDVENTPPPKFNDPDLIKIAKKYGKTTSQVVLRYLVDRGTIPIPKSTNKDRLIKNIDIFDFSLSKEEVDFINKFNKDFRVVDIVEWRGSPYYPY